MSYILDALKKSEQQRGHGSAPGVQTLHTADLGYHSSKTQLWPYFLLAAVVINLAALLYFIAGKSGEQTPAIGPSADIVALPAVDNVAQPRTTAVPDANPPVVEPAETFVYKPVSMPGPGQARATSAPTAVQTAASAPHPSAEPVVEMEELPMEVLQHIPVMEFSAHVYSTNPLQRSIVINGRFMEEGDRLASDLYLTEITRDGAVFDYQGQRFHQRVVSTWN